jgi:intracellular sulfur oxidation DsrE/DsrF family protein
MNRRLTTLLSLAALFVLSTAGAGFSHADESWPTIAVPEIAPQPKKVAKVHTHGAHKTIAPNKGVASQSRKPHRVVIQVTQNDPALMRTALNNAENLTSYFQKKGERVQIEIVAYGAGLHMLRSDTSPVLDRIKSFAQNNKQVTFSGCGNTLKAQSKQENKDITLVPEAHIVPAGIARITELQEQGWTYVRP